MWAVTQNLPSEFGQNRTRTHLDEHANAGGIHALDELHEADRVRNLATQSVTHGLRVGLVSSGRFA